MRGTKWAISQNRQQQNKFSSHQPLLFATLRRLESFDLWCDSCQSQTKLYQRSRVQAGTFFRYAFHFQNSGPVTQSPRAACAGIAQKPSSGRSLSTVAMLGPAIAATVFAASISPMPRRSESPADLIREYYPGVPLRRPLEEIESLVDISRIQNETGWSPLGSVWPR